MCIAFFRSSRRLVLPVLMSVALAACSGPVSPPLGIDDDTLVSSIPLPEIIPMIQGAPADVLAAASRLACTEAVIVCLGIDRADLVDAHWSYFYDRDVFFTRLSTPHLQSPHNVPPGCGSLQVNGLSLIVDAEDQPAATRVHQIGPWHDEVSDRQRAQCPAIVKQAVLVRRGEGRVEVVVVNQALAAAVQH